MRACLTNGRIGVDDHAFGDRQRAADLKLGSLFDFDQAHAAGGLQREPFVITKRRNFDAVLARGFDQQRAFCRFDGPSVNRQLDQFSHR